MQSELSLEPARIAPGTLPEENMLQQAVFERLFRGSLGRVRLTCRLQLHHTRKHDLLRRAVKEDITKDK